MGKNIPPPFNTTDEDGNEHVFVYFLGKRYHCYGPKTKDGFSIMSEKIKQVLMYYVDSTHEALDLRVKDG